MREKQACCAFLSNVNRSVSVNFLLVFDFFIFVWWLWLKVNLRIYIGQQKQMSAENHQKYNSPRNIIIIKQFISIQESIKYLF